MLFNAHGYVIYIHNINTIVQERYFTTICHRSRDWKEVNHIFGRCTGSWQHAWALMDRQWLNLGSYPVAVDCYVMLCPRGLCPHAPTQTHLVVIFPRLIDPLLVSICRDSSLNFTVV